MDVVFTKAPVPQRQKWPEGLRLTVQPAFPLPTHTLLLVQCIDKILQNTRLSLISHVHKKL